MDSLFEYKEYMNTVAGLEELIEVYSTSSYRNSSMSRMLRQLDYSDHNTLIISLTMYLNDPRLYEMIGSIDSTLHII